MSAGPGSLYEGESPVGLVDSIEDSRRGMLADEDSRHQAEIARINRHHDLLLQIANGGSAVSTPTLVQLALDVCGPWTGLRFLDMLAVLLPRRHAARAEADARAEAQDPTAENKGAEPPKNSPNQAD